MSGHTPGPWRFGNASEDQRLVLGEDGGYVCNVQIYQTPRYMGQLDEPEREANARLIAAAPVLLGQHEADMVDLELLAKAIHAGDPMPELVIRVTDMLNRKRAAIAKATGEHP